MGSSYLSVRPHNSAEIIYSNPYKQNCTELPIYQSARSSFLDTVNIQQKTEITDFLLDVNSFLRTW
jgi:hypothetical protein